MKNLAVITLALATAIPAVASARKIYHSDNGRSLTSPSQRGASAVAVDFLRSKGLNGLTTSTLRTSEQLSARTGVTHVRIAQEVEGLRVHGAYAKAAVDARGQLVHAIDELVTVSGKVRRGTAGDADALATVLKALHPAAGQPPLVGRSGNTASFARGSYFHQDPTVERVALSSGAGLEAGFVVTTWSNRGNLLHESVVDASGRLVSSELRTNTDSYNVFAVDPEKSAQSTYTGDGSWLGAGAQTTWDISGPNAHAYLDTNANNAPDSGGVAVDDGNFATQHNPGVQPSTVDNKSVAVQNLFYLNNRLHDVLLAAGFTPGTGNFEGTDPVNAEAQDGSGTDNANFSTPADGTSPRMQMYLWNGRGSHQVLNGGNSYEAAGAAFGAALTTTGLSGALATAVPANGCTTIAPGSLNAMVAIVDRGGCDFVVKVRNAQNAGARAVIVANNVSDGIFDMGGSDRKITIPSVMVGLSSGDALKAAVGTSATVRKNPSTPIMRDGDLDSDIVYHEYGHGLTWRMIGGMSGVFAGAIGEGMSDVLAITINNDDIVGEYSYSDPVAGIRRYPYEGYPLTYGSMNSGTREVHNDGEIYAAIGWRLVQDLKSNYGFSVDDALAFLVDGMNFTPASPKFEDMRDGLLAASPDSAVSCAVWRSFAHFGVGVGAKGTTKGPKASVIESSALPTSCQ